MGREKNGFNQTLLFCFLLLFWWFFVPFFGHLTRMPRLPRSMRASSTPNPIVMPNAIFFPLIFRVATVWQCRGKLIESIINDATYERCALRTQRAQWSLIFSPFSNLSWVLVRIPVDWNRFFNTFRFVWYTLWLYRNLHRSPLICAVLLCWQFVNDLRRHQRSSRHPKYGLAFYTVLPTMDAMRWTIVHRYAPEKPFQIVLHESWILFTHLRQY